MQTKDKRTKIIHLFTYIGGFCLAAYSLTEWLCIQANSSLLIGSIFYFGLAYWAALFGFILLALTLYGIFFIPRDKYRLVHALLHLAVIVVCLYVVWPVFSQGRADARGATVLDRQSRSIADDWTDYAKVKQAIAACTIDRVEAVHMGYIDREVPEENAYISITNSSEDRAKYIIDYDIPYSYKDEITNDVNQANETCERKIEINLEIPKLMF